MNEGQQLVAIDLGSNSFHLVIARELDGSVQLLHREKQRIRLAAGLDSQGNLTTAAMDQAIECLAQFNQRFDRLPANAVKIVATQTLRKAANRDDFIRAAYKVLPYPIQVISGEEEAQLIYQGVAHTQPLSGKTLVIDIGGGSTEFVIGEGFASRQLASLEMGCVTFTQAYFADGAIDSNRWRQAEEHAGEQLAQIADRYRQCGWHTTLGTSGSIKAIREVMIELYGEAEITALKLANLKSLLIAWGSADDIRLTSLNAQRRPLIAAAAAILMACFDRLALDELNFCDSALREGVLYQLSDFGQDRDIRNRTVDSLARLYHIDVEHNKRVVKALKSLVSQDDISQQLNGGEKLLYWAGQLHEIGLHVNSRGRHRHGAYLIEHSEMPGFDEQQQQVLAFLIRHHRKSLKSLEFPPCNGLGHQQLLLMLQLLRLAIILSHGRHRRQPVTGQLSLQKPEMRLHYEHRDDDCSPGLDIELAKEAAYWHKWRQ